MKNPLTLAGIEPATFRFVAQHLSQCATAVPYTILGVLKIGTSFLLQPVLKHVKRRKDAINPRSFENTWQGMRVTKIYKFHTSRKTQEHPRYVNKRKIIPTRPKTDVKMLAEKWVSINFYVSFTWLQLNDATYCAMAYQQRFPKPWKLR